MPEPILITSPANPTIRHLVRMRDNRARRKANRVIVDGWRETAQALASGMELIGLYYLGEAEIANDQHGKLATASDENVWAVKVIHSEQSKAKTTWVTRAILEKIGYGQSVRGVVAEFSRPDQSLDQIRWNESPMVMVLDQIEKPGNVGAIFRSADAAGFDAVLMCDGGDPLHPNAIRSSSGGVFHVPWAQGSFDQVSEALARNSFRVLTARVESSQSLWATNWSGSVAVVVGNEADGLKDRWTDVGGRPTEGIHIPMAGQVDSLNVSVAAAVIMMTAAAARPMPPTL